MTTDDAALIEAITRGSDDALGALYRRYWPLAWHWAYAISGRRETAEDYAQEAMLRAVEALPRFDVQRAFAPWLKRIVVNVAVDDLRRNRRSRARELKHWMAERRELTDDRGPALNTVIDAVAKLPPPRRLVVVLHYWLDLTVDEIAATLDVPYGTVASRLSRALAGLRVVLEEETRA